MNRKSHTAANADPIIRKAAANHTAANADLIIRRAAASHIAANTDPTIRRAANLAVAIDLNVLITINAAALAEDVERKRIDPEIEEILSVNGIKGICGNTAVSARHSIIIFETLFKREYDKKGFFLFHREIK
ncbi:hypothetical protein P9A91_11095 [Bacillus safensis]|nr:hypothetical protein [Bacillus safensis]MCY7473718.1 hypothetical protein [Bacillus safensis]MEC1078561.1 hypothetical protein [Bacillus safensis]